MEAQKSADKPVQSSHVLQDDRSDATRGSTAKRKLAAGGRHPSAPTLVSSSQLVPSAASRFSITTSNVTR